MATVTIPNYDNEKCGPSCPLLQIDRQFCTLDLDIMKPNGCDSAGFPDPDKCPGPGTYTLTKVPADDQ